jgi:hypothetical protein
MVAAFYDPIYNDIKLTANDRPITLTPLEAVLLAAELLKAYHEITPERV